MDPVSASITLAITLLEHSNELATLFAKARAEGRDPTEDELAALRSKRRSAVAEAIAMLDGTAPT